MRNKNAGSNGKTSLCTLYMKTFAWSSYMMSAQSATSSELPTSRDADDTASRRSTPMCRLLSLLGDVGLPDGRNRQSCCMISLKQVANYRSLLFI